jgi:hypothetical protein
MGKTVKYGGFLPSAAIMNVRVKDYADPTGGEIFNADAGHVAEKLVDLPEEHRARSLGYMPGNQEMGGEFRRIQVRLRHTASDESPGKATKLAIVTKRGYFARTRDDGRDTRRQP